MPSTTPIRVAIIGLSSSAKTAWASRAHLPYLLSPLGRSKYQIVALLNSSVSAARAAIAAYNLPDSTRAYGDPAALAADDEVDLVVCTTRVDKHYETVLDSVRAGKDVFVEWPLAHDAQHARELAEQAQTAGGKTVVGAQGVRAPITLKLRGLLEEGKIGRVVSAELRVFGGLNDRVKVPEGLAYFTERGVGGNIYTIGFAHSEWLFKVITEAALTFCQFSIWCRASLGSSQQSRVTSTCSGQKFNCLIPLATRSRLRAPTCRT